MAADRPQRLSAATRCLLLAAALVAAPAAEAALGGDEASVVADAATMRGRAQPTDYPHYRLERAVAASGLEIREYLGADGQVFAVAWNGPVPPDLQRLLGSFYPEYTSALIALRSPGLRRSLRLSLPGVTIESGGHLRAYSGRAYLPDRVPLGVGLGELK